MFQRVDIIGNLGGEPEMRFMPDSTAVTSFSVATTKKWNDSSGQQQKVTTWFRVSAWGKRAEVCNKYLSKGSKVFVTGELQPDKSTGAPRIFTKANGEAGASFELRANNVLFVNSRGEQVGLGDTAPQGGNGGGYTVEEDDIPF